jgi:LacI family transcriptional regulator
MDTHKVTVENFKSAYDSTAYLVSLGYKRIAHVTSFDDTSVMRERLAGYEKALVDNGVIVDQDLIKHCFATGRDRAKLKETLDELFALKQPPDVIFSAFDKITTVTLSLLHEMKKSVPEDVALLGFTNTILADILNPPLTSITQPGFEMGKEATRMLIHLIKDEHLVTKFETIVLPTELVVRDSCPPKK